MGIMTSIKYIFPEFVATYPYWAKDEKNDLFLVVCPGTEVLTRSIRVLYAV